MINISNRLKTIAEIILNKQSNKIIDVGCDHALLDIYLLQNNDSLNLVASDNKKQPLENAKKNITKYSFLNKIELCLKDGIENIDKDIDTVVISGMGEETIIDILEKDKNELEHINRLVISSNNKYYDLRRKITSLGYIITDERIVFEDNKYYLIIEFIKGNKNYSEEELFMGPILINNKDDLFIKYYSDIKKEKEYILNKITNDDDKKKTLIEEINYINKNM